MFQQTNRGICFKVKVIPKASRSEVVGWENDELKIRLAAVPAKGEANDELIEMLADLLEVGKKKVQIIQGEKSRHKRICVEDLTIGQLEQRLGLNDNEMERKKNNETK